jgi:hypothetical protein
VFEGAHLYNNSSISIHSPPGANHHPMCTAFNSMS